MPSAFQTVREFENVQKECALPRASPGRPAGHNQSQSGLSWAVGIFTRPASLPGQVLIKSGHHHSPRAGFDPLRGRPLNLEVYSA